MNRSLKRKRRSSDGCKEDEDYDYNQEEKRSRYEASSPAEIEPSAISSPVPKSSHHQEGTEPSSRLFHSDVVDHEDASSECGCETCTQGGSMAGEALSYIRSQTSEVEIDPDLQALESELDDDVQYDTLESSANSHRDYSYQERIHGSELLVSSPVAGSIVDSDFEDEDDLPDKHDECDEIDDGNDADDEWVPKRTSKAVPFLGQLTPGSSVGKVRPSTPECNWTSFRKLSVHSGFHGAEAMCPVPHLSWASKEKFWEVMCKKDETSLTTRNPNLFDHQAHLTPQMRMILLDWLSEVAAVFEMNRETFYLTVDYVDRYLSSKENIPRNELQLIGVTCLLIASKMEQVYPPPIEKLASVTDGACTEQRIFTMEITILSRLNWLLSPITINNWLEMLLQFIYQKLEKKNSNVLTPHFSSSLYKKLCQLLDLVTLDFTSLSFSYCVLAASAIYILVDPDLAISTSGLEKKVLEPCVQWMSVYWKALKETHSSEMADVNDLLTDKSEIYFTNQRPEIQTHYSSTKLLYESVQKKLSKTQTGDEMHILTPPSSASKCTPVVVNEVDATS